MRSKSIRFQTGPSRNDNVIQFPSQLSELFCAPTQHVEAKKNERLTKTVRGLVSSLLLLATSLQPTWQLARGS